MKTLVLFMLMSTLGFSFYNLKEGEKEVDAENYIRATTDREFNAIQNIAGGVNKLFHFRQITPLTKQAIIRMNRDVLYSMGVVNTEGEATITFPEMPDNRYASIYIVDNDHYVPEVIYKPGTYVLPNDTKYIGVGVRIQVFNPDDLEEIKMVNALQDQFIIQANNTTPLTFDWNKEQLSLLTKEYNQEFGAYEKYPSDWQGKRGEVNEETRHLAAAGAFGLFPEKEATYINYNQGNLKGSEVYKATYQVPEHNGFWSLTVYGEDGYMKSEKSVLNASNTLFNEDGTFTVYFGSQENCPKDAENRLDITDGWNFLMRVYLPGASVLNNEYILPEVEKL